MMKDLQGNIFLLKNNNRNIGTLKKPVKYVRSQQYRHQMALLTCSRALIVNFECILYFLQYKILT